MNPSRPEPGEPANGRGADCPLMATVVVASSAGFVVGVVVAIVVF